MAKEFSAVKSRLVQFLEYKGVRKEEFYVRIGMTSASFRGEARNRPLNSTAIENILSILPTLNLRWLFTGIGDMEESMSSTSVGSISGNNNILAHGNNNSVSMPPQEGSIEEDIQWLKVEIEKKNIQIAEKDEQIRRLSEMLSASQAITQSLLSRE